MKSCDNQGNCTGGCCGLCCTKIEDFNVSIGKTKILENVNLHIHCGELTAIIGPNGAGKSTLLKAILGEVRHTGVLKYMDSKGERGGHPIIGYVPQHLDFDIGSPVSVQDLFVACKSKLPAWLFTRKGNRQQIENSLTKVEALHLLHRRLGALSGGELQRIMLALALDPIPDILLLDEPVSGIDQNGLELFYRIVSELRNQYDLSVILISHDLDLVHQYADRVVLLNKTVICNGTPSEVFANEKLHKTFGISFNLLNESSAGSNPTEVS